MNAWAFGLSRNEVLEVAYSYADGGGYCRLKDSGVTDSIKHNGSVILPASEGGSYCCGFTFQVAMKIAERRGLLADKSADQLRRFQKQWYGSAPDSEPKECAMAVEDLGIGREIAMPKARPGDFMILHYREQGHSVVFLDWIRGNRGELIGLRYRSSQLNTNGIGDCVEYFIDSGGAVDRNQVYVARLNRTWWSRLLYPF